MQNSTHRELLELIVINTRNLRTAQRAERSVESLGETAQGSSEVIQHTAAADHVGHSLGQELRGEAHCIVSLAESSGIVDTSSKIRRVDGRVRVDLTHVATDTEELGVSQAGKGSVSVEEGDRVLIADGALVP